MTDPLPVLAALWFILQSTFESFFFCTWCFKVPFTSEVHATATLNLSQSEKLLSNLSVGLSSHVYMSYSLCMYEIKCGHLKCALRQKCCQTKIQTCLLVALALALAFYLFWPIGLLRLAPASGLCVVLMVLLLPWLSRMLLGPLLLPLTFGGSWLFHSSAHWHQRNDGFDCELAQQNPLAWNSVEL